MEINFEEIKNFKQINLYAKQLVEGFITGLHKSPYHGFSVEFSEHKLYNFGDSVRHIDWKVFAKTNKLYTKKYEEETNLRSLLVIDTSSSMYYPEKLFKKIKFSILSTLSLCYLLQSQRDAVGLCSFTDKITAFTEIKSTINHLNKLTEILKNLFEQDHLSKKTDIAKVLHEIAIQTPKRSLIIIFSDMFQPNMDTKNIFNGLQHLKSKNHEILLFHVTDKYTEYNFNFKNKPYEFVDLETQDYVKVHPYEVKDYFTEISANFTKKIIEKCAQLKIDLIEADVNTDYNKVIRQFLIKRNKL